MRITRGSSGRLIGTSRYRNCCRPWFRLRGENRYFVKEGIRRMRVSKRPAIQALTRVAGTEQATLTEESIGFMIGPRLNAAGRLGDASPAVELLKTEDVAVATALAKELDALNKERQGIVAEITREAEEIIVNMYGDTVPLVFVIARRRLEFRCCWYCRFSINGKILSAFNCPID